jgi:hypothetical protein
LLPLTESGKSVSIPIMDDGCVLNAIPLCDGMVIRVYKEGTYSDQPKLAASQ